MQNNQQFFKIYEEVLGVASASLNGLVYIPQIYTLFKYKNRGSNSILTYALQTPGNVVVIIYQAVLFHAPITTWLTYLLVLIEQSIILIILVTLYCKEKKEKEFLYDGLAEVDDTQDI